MMSIFSAIGVFLGKILKAILPGLIKEGKKPRDVRPAGFDKGLKDDMDNQLEDQLK